MGRRKGRGGDARIKAVIAQAAKQAKPVNNLETQILARVRNFGWAMAALVPNPPGDPLGWTYSVGMCLRGLPELVIPDMPGLQAAGHLRRVIELACDGVRLRAGDSLSIDGDTWLVEAQNPRDSAYGTPTTLRLFGARFVVRALRLMPPPSLAFPPGMRWSGHHCECGCASFDPLDEARHAGGVVGSTYLPGAHTGPEHETVIVSR